MRVAFSLLFLFATPILPAQGNLWAHVNPNYSGSRLDPAALSASQKNAIFSLFRSSGQLSAWDCAEEGNGDDLLQGLTFKAIPLSTNQNVILIEAGAGCARGGQGANGAMWLVRFDATGPVFLATPEQKFSGWLFSIEPTTSNGYRDIILGWHMSAFETDLSYFRFDGKFYRCIGNAADVTDEKGDRIVPNLPPAPSAHP